MMNLTAAGMIEVFKTNVTKVSEAKKLVCLLLLHFPDCRINFDLTDCDKILRVEGCEISALKVVALVQQNGFNCHVLE